ncbi:hypothetical protein XENTR_v10011459 [Xenopus tropicalis]|eukprot:XP_012816723.1 PREDICTED: COX assembly mitochondrial protein 2 homolog isoform X2 [Xenopus tropicalis]
MNSHDAMAWGGAHLSSHLHTDECNVAINLLKKCHSENQFLKYFGQCNDFDREMRKCLKKEYEDRRAKSRARSEHMKQRLLNAEKQADN